MNALAVGGSGFIGSHVVEALQEDGYTVTVLDPERPSYPLAATTEYVEASTADEALHPAVLNDTDTVFLLSGRTGIGGSLEKPRQYYRDNVLDLVPLLAAIGQSDVTSVVAASTILVHGEGPYRCSDCGVVYPGKRDTGQLERGEWEHRCGCGNVLAPVHIRENHPVQPRTPYSRSKLAFEHVLTDMLHDEINLTILRYPFVYGPRQGGAADYFFTAVLNGERPRLFEDGKQLRDFMYVEDVADATVEAATVTGKQVYTIGSGEATSLEQFVARIGGTDTDVEPRIPGEFRAYDVRHNIPDTTRFEDDVQRGCTPLEEGIRKTLEYYRQKRS